MQLSAFVAVLLASAASARTFTLFEHQYYGGSSHVEQRPDDARCWNLNGKGDKASSVMGGDGCTTFFRNRDCRGDHWTQRGNAPTVPTFLNDHIWSFTNKC